MVHSRTAILILAVAVLAAPAHAQSLADNLELHGFAGWGYGDTDGHTYQWGTDDGSYDNASLSLNLSAAPADHLTIVAQVEWDVSDDDDEVELDFVFAEWSFSDHARLRMGQVKHPFGIYTEVYDVGTLRPFLLLPQGLYGPSGFVAEAYRGVGLVGSFYSESDWGIEYDVFFGKIHTPFDHPLLHLPSGAADWEDNPQVDLAYDEVFGGRLIVRNPLAGLNFGLSAFTGMPDEDARMPVELGGLEDRRTVFGVHGEYLDDAWWIRSEYAFTDVDGSEHSSAYAEIAYRITENWQVAGRWDWTEMKDAVPPELMIPDQFWNHEDVGIAVNYWFNPNLVVKLEYHTVDDNRYASVTGEALALAMMTGQIEDTTDLVQIGAQFSF